MNKIVACWHHGDKKRLKDCLDRGYCDLHPLAVDCPPKRMSAETFYSQKLGLMNQRECVRFAVKRVIVATGTIASRPYDFERHREIKPVDPHWPGAVDIDDVEWLNGNERCVEPSGSFGSHRLRDC